MYKFLYPLLVLGCLVSAPSSYAYGNLDTQLTPRSDLIEVQSGNHTYTRAEVEYWLNNGGTMPEYVVLRHDGCWGGFPISLISRPPTPPSMYTRFYVWYRATPTSPNTRVTFDWTPDWGANVYMVNNSTLANGLSDSLNVKNNSEPGC